MTVEEIHPFVRYAKVHTTHPPKKESSRAYDCRLFYITSGEGMLYANEKSYRIFSHTAIYIFPAISYRFVFKQPNNINICVLNFDFVTEPHTIQASLGVAKESDFDARRIRSLAAPEEFRHILVVSDAFDLSEHVSACADLFLKQPPHFRALASAHLKLALITLLTKHHESTYSNRTVREVQVYIRENFSHTSLSNEQLAARFGYHPYHLSRLFKLHTGFALHEYLLNYRLHIAKNYLATTDLRITDIAEACGFSSYTYFIKRFREHAGMSPLKYRAARRSANNADSKDAALDKMAYT